ncbi:MAG: hypothetical protein GF308_10395 [Candidatus Heimdallarchaeota archaeon]|nr:hypothetical protein [Candidatus Heimdallarchaeota archaeon]
MIDETNLNLAIAIYQTITAILFCITTRKRRDLFFWSIGVIFAAFGAIIVFFQIIDPVFRLIGNSLYIVAALIYVGSVIYEYYNKFIKTSKDKQERQKKIRRQVLVLCLGLFLVIIAILFLAIFSILNAIVIVQLILLIPLWLVNVMLLQIHLKEQTTMHLFMFLVMFVASGSLINTILASYNINGAWELSYALNFVYITFFLATGLAARIELKIIKSEERYREAYNLAEFYKDLFAHDIGNILQYMRSSIDLIRILESESVNSPQIQQTLDILNEQVIRGSMIVSNIKQLSSLKESKLDLYKINVQETVSEAIKYIRSNFINKKIEFLISPISEDFFIKGNHLFLEVVKNIFVNAIRFNKSPLIKIWITISRISKKNRDYLQIEFKDNGIGISDCLKEDLFKDPLNRKAEVTGIGLGLSLIYEVLETYNAEIWVEDRIKGDPSQGSNFIIQIEEEPVKE